MQLNKTMMEYNTTRPVLLMREYGRTVQKMVEHVMTIEDFEQRSKVARMIVNVMGLLNPHIREYGDYKHKLWDHLYIMSDFKLEVESPYPRPVPEIILAKPDRIGYPDKKMRYRHYGKNIMKIIDKAVEMENGNNKELVAALIANTLKRSYLTWNRDSVTDEIIIEQLSELSEGGLTVPENTKLAHVAEVIQRPARKPGQNNRNNNNRKQFGRQNFNPNNRNKQ
ncbi:MAG: DUF4290 domain-containing protein [Bacteroidota bacterium]